MTAETIRTNSREELVQLIGLPKVYALSRFKENIPIHADVVAGTLYDSLTISNFDSFKNPYIPGDHREIRFFYDPTGKTPVETNVTKAGQLDAPESFAIKGIGFVFSPTTDPEDRMRLAERFELIFCIGQRYYFRKPIAHIFGEGEGNLADPRKPFAGYSDLQDFPLVMTDQSSFRGTLAGESFELHSPLRAWMVIYGLHLRGIC